MSPNTHEINFTSDELDSIYTVMRNNSNPGDPNYGSALNKIESAWTKSGASVGATKKK